MTLCTYGHRFARTPKPGEPGDECAVDHWLEVFETKHDWDAHAWCYVRYENGELAPAVRAASVAGRVATPGLFLCSLIFLDYDKSNDHVAILDRITRLPEDYWLSRYAAIYPTKGGMRIVYRLTEPVTTEEYPEIVRGVASELAIATGIQVDPTTDQWSRCFRLPSVVRDDDKAKGPTWEQPYYFPPLITEMTVSPDDLPKRKDRLAWDTRGAHVAETAPEQRPDVDMDLPPSRHKAYKRALRPSRFKDYIFDGVEIMPGRRDQTIVAMAGDAVAKGFPIPESSAEEVFLLLKPVVMALENDGSEPWVDKLWRLVQHSWNGECKKQEERVQKTAVDRTQRETLLHKMVAHLPVEGIPNDPVERDAHLARHLCLQTASGAYVVQPSGSYSISPLRATQLPAHFGDGLSYLSPTGFRNQQGKPLSGYEILNTNAINIDDIVYVSGKERSSKLVMEGDRRVLEITPFALRQDLVDTAEFDPDIDGWLSCFEQANELKRWLAAALALYEGPIASCYLHGPLRVGKTMLARGLAECFHGQPVPAASAFSEFNGALLHSPIILVDEGLPSRREGMSTADLFRSLVTGSAVSTQKKFQDQGVSNIPYRIIFAANSFDMVAQLIGKRSLGNQDREAFQERIIVVDTGNKPAEYLDRRGAMSFTKDSPKGSWLGGECRLARHLIRLYQLAFEESKFPRDGRMLVEGKPHPAFTSSFDLSGSGRDVVDELSTAIDKVWKKKANPGLYSCVEIDNGKVWIKTRPFVKYAISTNPSKAEGFAKALDRFLSGEKRQNIRDLVVQYRVDVDKLRYLAEAEGLDVSVLKELHLQAAGVA